jgi:hypothetical protein
VGIWDHLDKLGAESDLYPDAKVGIFKGLSKPFYRWVHLRWKVAQFVAKT